MASSHPGATWRIVLILSLAALAGYWNTFTAPFIFDDIPAIAENKTIRDLSRPGELLVPGALRGSGVAGRPVVNLSLALNRAISGDAVWSYHAFNLLVHICAGLALFGWVRRTLRLLPRSPALTRGSTELAFAVALLWLIHPLQTESVTCVIQRTESLCGLFFLLTFYTFVRAVDDANPRWLLVTVACCLAGSATKELMAVAPVLLVLFDRTFIGGSFGSRARGHWHLRFAAVSWLVVTFLLWRSDVRGGTVGFGRGMEWWHYALTQLDAVTMYLKLAVWPHPLVLDYGTGVVREFAAVWPQALLLAALVALTGWALGRRPALGFVGAWFFVILAPSSSVIPLITQTMAEHRMYLPLAAVIVLGVIGWQRVAGRGFWPGIAAAALAMLGLTVARNHDYRSTEAIWRDNLAKRPDSLRAHLTLGQLADAAGRNAEAVTHGEAALRAYPQDGDVRFNLAFSLEKAGRLDEAAARYREAVQLQPSFLPPHIKLGALALRLGRLDEAIAEFEAVTRLKPDSAEDEFNLAQAYATAGRYAEAIDHYQESARIVPDRAETHRRLGNAWIKQRGYAEAERAYRAALQLEPQDFESQVNLAGVLRAQGRLAEAIPCYEAALRIKFDPRVAEALAQLRTASR